MRIESTSNADEAADVSALWALQSRAGKAMKQRTILSCGISAAVASAFLFYRNGNSAPFIASVSVLIGVLAGGGYALAYDTLLRRRVRRYMRQTLGTAAYPFIVELRDGGVWFKLRDVEAQWAWTALRDVRETNRGVEMWFDTGILVARKRAFASPEEQEAFAAATRRGRP